MPASDVDEFMRELAPAPEPAPDATPAPDSGNDQGAEAIDRLMLQLLDELFQGLSPDGMLDPSSPDAGGDGTGA